ncbi:hypothetical protein QSK01_13965, partial [Staphylococcus aureus]|nr:hypothetical protein [Staphylococcus aureus]
KVSLETINNLKEKELIVEKNDAIALTNRGKVIGNEVFEAFLINAQTVTRIQIAILTQIVTPT